MPCIPCLMKREQFLAVITFIVITVAVTTGVFTAKLNKSYTDQQTKYKNSQVELKKVNQQLEYVKQEKAKQIDDSKQQVQKIQDLEQEKANLEQQVQAKVDEKSNIAQAATETLNTITATPTASADPLTATVDGCGDNAMANYIYTHESSCNLSVVNAEGCIGIGQACPASKLTAVCPGLDYACENAFFTDYANTRYGGWEGAYAFWTQNHWW
jgi:TolA-binding protein